MNFLMVFDFTQFWVDGRPENTYFLFQIFGHLWDRFVFVHSGLKQIYAIPPSVPLQPSIDYKPLYRLLNVNSTRVLK